MVRAIVHRDRNGRQLTRRAFLRRAGGALAALGGAALFGPPLYAEHYAGKISPRVRVAGVDLGGTARAVAIARLTDRARAYSASPVRVLSRPGGPWWSVTPAELDVRFDIPAAVDAALATGRRGHWWTRSAALLGMQLPRAGAELTLPTTLDDARLKATLRGWADVATVRPADAAFVVGPDGRLTIEADRPGCGIDLNATRAAFLGHAAALRGVADQAASLTARPFTLRQGAWRWTVDPARLGAALAYRQDGDHLVVALRPGPLQPVFDQVARDAARPGVDARIALGPDGRYRIDPDQAGVALDREATLGAIDAALNGGGHEAPVALTPRPSAITAADLQPAYARLDAILNTPLIVAFAEYRRILGRADIQPLLVLAAQPDQPEKVAIALDGAKVRALAQAVATALDREPRDARFRWVDGAVEDVNGGQEGRTVQVEATAAALAAAILGVAGRAVPVVTAIAPRVGPADKAAIAIPPHRLGYGRTDYSFSIPNRAWNVELAMRRLDGTLVPPNGVFSFNEAVGAQTVANGYREAYGIALVGGSGPGTSEVKTVSSVAGGICQVSTTLFQAAYRAGLPIVERNWHLYWIESYGPPSSPTGLRGLDATVDDQAGLDFRFTNTTGGWLALEAVADGVWVRIAIYGRDPGWIVRLDDPVLTDVRPADLTFQVEKTHDLPPGQEVVVEHAVDGFDAANHIRVLDRAGAVLRDVTFRSSYVPSRNVAQVGVPEGEPLAGR